MTRLLQTMGGLTGRGPSVGGPAGFRVQQPLKWQLCGNTQCQQLAELRPCQLSTLECCGTQWGNQSQIPDEHNSYKTLGLRPKPRARRVAGGGVKTQPHP